MPGVGNRPALDSFGNAVAVVLFIISMVIALRYQRFVLRRDTDGAPTDHR